MPEPSAALHDFAIVTRAEASLDLLTEVIAGLRERWSKPPPSIELLGRPDSGEVLVLLRFPIVHSSAELRRKMEREAGRLHAGLIEPRLLAPQERKLFYAERLASYPAREDANEDLRIALRAFRARMGLSGGGAALAVRFDSEDDLAAACARCATEGRLRLPGVRPFPEGTVLALSLQAPGLKQPLNVQGRVLAPVLPIVGARLSTEEGASPTPFAQDGLRVQLEPDDELNGFLARYAARARTGQRRMPEGGRRQHPRFDVLLEVAFDAAARLHEEYATNLGRGGLFVRTASPPPLRSRVRLRVKLPDGVVAETDAEVVHLVSVEEARQQGTSPGAGLSFATGDTLFMRAIESFLASVPGRKPRILVADDDRLLREVLRDALTAAGLLVEVAADGNEALRRIGAHLFGFDALVVDLLMPGLDGYCLIDRVRQLARELELKIAVLSGTSTPAELELLHGPGGADEVIAKGTPLEEIVAKILHMLGR